MVVDLSCTNKVYEVDERKTFSDSKRDRRRRRVWSPPWSLSLSILVLLALCSDSPKNNSGTSSYGGVLPIFASFASAAETHPTTYTQSDQEQQQQQERNIRARAMQRVTTSTSASLLSPPQNQQEPLHFHQLLYRAGVRALGGGLPGAAAGAVQVLALMWLRTIINYQCRYGTQFPHAVRTLWNDGGVARLYRGVGFALIQAPLARFVSTAVNDGMQVFLGQMEWTASWGPGRTTVVASIVVGVWRMVLMPIDTMKTVLQVDSYEGFRSLMRRVKAGKISVLYSGAIANAVSAIMGHYPWFYTYNTLSTSAFVRRYIPSQFFRNAGIGVLASIVSDTVVNAVRVIKTTKQSLGSKQNASYADTVKIIVAADGWRGLFGRGLRTRIFANALQSLVFTVVWRGLADRWRRKGEETDEKISASVTSSK